MHMQRMLKMSRFYTLADILSKIFVKKRRKIGDIIYDHGLPNLLCGANLIFIKNILCDHDLHDLHLYIQKMLTYREMVNYKKWNFFRFFVILLL